MKRLDYKDYKKDIKNGWVSYLVILLLAIGFFFMLGLAGKADFINCQIGGMC